MAHYAVIDPETNIVESVFVGKDETDPPGNWETYYAPPGLIVRRTSYNTRGGIHYDPATGEPSADQSDSYRYNYAGPGYTYDPDFGTDGAFIPPKPWPSWVLDPDTALWVAPVPYPDDCPCGAEWDETVTNWVCRECPES